MTTPSDGSATVDDATLVHPERHPLRSADAARKLGAIIVFAPHPDDETLGCGGLLGLAAAAQQRVEVVIVTDGSRSHPQSRTHPPARLVAIREQETMNALAALGLPASCVRFLRHPDCGLPEPGTVPFAAAVAQVQHVLTDFAPDTILVPWQRDPHCDHVASWHVIRAASQPLQPTPRWIEYPVWAWTQPEGAAGPRAADGRAWRLDIASVLPRKLDAIAAYPSQTGGLIHDDPTGFVLEPAVLAHFHRPWELFIEPLGVARG